MKNLKQPLVAVAMLLLWSLVGYSQSITPIVNNGDVDYGVSYPVPNTHVFTIMGDGNYSVVDQPKHHFDDTGSFNTVAYFVKPYNTNPPAIVSTTTNITSTSGTYKKYRPRMAGEIDVLYSWCPASNYENYFILAFTNLKSQKPIDGCIDFHWHTDEMSMNYAGIEIFKNWVVNQQQLPSSRTLQNQKLTWEFSDLKHNERRYVYIPAEVILKPKSKLNLYASFSVKSKTPSNEGNGKCGAGGSSIVKTSNVLKFPVDPNGKNVFPTCWHQFVEPIQYLEYDINFYNDGNAEAVNVVVIDDLSPWLDPNTFVLLDSEYPAHVNITGHQVVIEYPGIHLPGKNQVTGVAPDFESFNEEEYSTYLSFGICTKPINSLTPCIKNSAKIYFDNQPAVKTTVAETCIKEQCGYDIPCDPSQYRIGIETPAQHQSSENIDQLKVWPNPFGEEIELSFNLNLKSGKEVAIDIVNVHGVVQRRFDVGMEQEMAYNGTLVLNDLPSGLYFLILTVDGEQRIERIMKY